MTGGGATLRETARWGKRKLAYAIEKKNEGYYVIFYFTTEGRFTAMLEQFERTCRYDEQVMRQMVVNVPTKRRGQEVAQLVPSPGWLSEFKLEPRAHSFRRRAEYDRGGAAAPAPAAAAPAPAQGLAQCSVGQVVASPAGHHDKYLQSVVIAVTPGHPFPCRVHPLGYLSTMEESFKPSMLRSPGSVATEPVGGIADDPHLLALKGQKAFKASVVAPGSYECWGAGSGGQLSARMALNFTARADGHTVESVIGRFRSMLG